MTLPGLAVLPRGLLVCLALLNLLAPCIAPRAEETATPKVEREPLDPQRSSADFEVKVLWLIGVHGRFGKVEGAVTIDRAANTAVAEARIDVERITMRTRGYEDWAKSDEFFDARRYPHIRFVSETFPLGRLRDGGDIAGTLSVRGVDRHVTLKVAPSACPQAIARDCPVQASGTIRRSDFGMKARRGSVSDNVDLGFSIYVVPADTAASQAL